MLKIPNQNCIQLEFVRLLCLFLTGLSHLHKILPLEIHSFLAQSLENLMHQMKGKIAPLYLFRDDGILQTVLKKGSLHFNSTWILQPLWAYFAYCDTLICLIGIQSMRTLIDYRPSKLSPSDQFRPHSASSSSEEEDALES